MDERLTYATVDLLATSVAKIARALATDTTCAESCSRETVHSLAKFCGTDSMWQRDILAAPHSALVSACATSPSRVCPHRRGLALLAGVRRDLARAFVIRAGPRGGFFRASEGAESEDVGTEDAGVEREEGIVGMEMNAITSLAGVLDVVKRWNVGPGSTVYSRLSASVQVLAAAVGGVDGVRESLGDAKKLVEVLHRMHAAIPDARQLIAARSEVSNIVHLIHGCKETNQMRTSHRRRNKFRISRFG
ncbi:hypothetical protein BC830DRAFT_64768 [Chytriomyces sp. MP71]|nr:hypothetical protein BC830DRAFT_64768 [Chytriomyces sp. MP71]